ncbi:MAG: peptidylprolyl isomerase [Blastocatellia bacterium]|nr:peptidylprolyl isomerase [Blastocatellia bacterium]
MFTWRNALKIVCLLCALTILTDFSPAFGQTGTKRRTTRRKTTRRKRTTVPTKPATPTAQPTTTPTQANPNAKYIATLETSLGTIKVELLTKDAPKTTENFRLLASREFYNGLTFHRVIKGFMIQGGDPNGNGTGGQSAWGGDFEDEINPASEIYQTGYRTGVVAMANRGPNTNGSQFFIMHKDYPLPPKYTIFGRVISGQEVVDAIATTPTNFQDRPVVPVVMKTVKIEEK